MSYPETDLWDVTARESFVWCIPRIAEARLLNERFSKEKFPAPVIAIPCFRNF